MKILLRDIFLSSMICSIGVLMAYGLPNAMLQGWTIISGGIFLIGLSIFQSSTSCLLCRLDKPHTMSECFSERLKSKKQKVGSVE